MPAQPTTYVRTMAFRSWLALMLACVGTLICVGLSTMFLLDRLLSANRANELRQSGRQLASDITSQPDVLEQTAFAKGWRIMTLDSRLNVLDRWDGFDVTTRGLPLGRLPALAPSSVTVMTQLHDRIRETGQTAADHIQRGTDDIQTVYYLTALPPDAAPAAYLYIASVVLQSKPVEDALRAQYWVMAGLLILVTAVSAHFTTQANARPITNLTKGAQRLAHGDFSIKFDGRPFVETDQLASTLNYAAQELRTLDSDRKELLANVSHDLKTPLTIIKIYAETIRDISGDDSDKRSAHCETIIEEANRLTDMVNEIVEISRLESGAAKTDMVPLDLAACLQDTLTAFAIMEESSGHTITVETIPHAPVVGDEGYLKRALYNLIGNAINYTGDDGYVGVKMSSAHGYIHVEVTDHGPGIPADKIATVWDRYHKSRSPRKRSVIGSGIGLSIVRHILTLHGATFGVTSSPGGGSCFWFDIPECPIPAEPADAHTGAPTEAKASAVAGRPETATEAITVGPESITAQPELDRPAPAAPSPGDPA